MSDVSFPLELSSKGRLRRSASRIECRCSDHPHDLLFYYLLLLLLLYVLPRSRGTGPLVLSSSALLLDEPASAGLRSNMLVIFREAEVAFWLQGSSRLALA